MFVKCNNCKAKLPVVVLNWNIIPMFDSESSSTSGIRLGLVGDVSINPDIAYRIKPHSDTYRCRQCGYESEYPSEEITFD